MGLVSSHTPTHNLEFKDMLQAKEYSVHNKNGKVTGKDLEEAKLSAVCDQAGGVVDIVFDNHCIDDVHANPEGQEVDSKHLVIRLESLLLLCVG